MANFSINTKNQIYIDKKPRVFFTCHPNDFDKYFLKICKDVFKTHDCAIYYTEDMTEKIPEDEREVDLGRSHLLVVPITYSLLSTPNRAMDEDVPYAIRNCIPILPILMEPGLVKIYSRRDKFGELQYINRFSTDVTEVSYEDKLKKFLETALLGDETLKRIRAAFDAYIFLSYRKKDRKHANKLMRLIHSNSECYDVAVWFDEFLTPGESFKENIEKVLADCRLFTLLVTPNIFEKIRDENGKERENYVISTELPLAFKNKEEKGIDILAIEMEKTDEKELFSINIESYVNVASDEFSTMLLDSISKIKTLANRDPEHDFLIGLAYLEGIDVEVDRERGVSLITRAAEGGYLGAMQRLYYMYLNGLSVKADYKKAAYWADRIVEHQTAILGDDHIDTLDAMNDAAVVYGRLGKHREALDAFAHISEVQRRDPEKHRDNILVTFNNMAAEYAELGEHGEALNIHKTVYDLYLRFFVNDNYIAIAMLNNLAAAYFDLKDYRNALDCFGKAYELLIANYGADHDNASLMMNNIAMCCIECDRGEKAIEIQKEAYRSQVEKTGENHPYALHLLNNLGTVCHSLGKNKHATTYLSKAYELRAEVLGYDHPDTVKTLLNLAWIQKECGDYKSALKLYEKGHRLALRVFGKDHYDTAIAFRELASVYGKLGDHKKALELKEKAYNQHRRVFGNDAYDTLIAMNNLAHTHCELGDYRKALNLQERVFDAACGSMRERPSFVLTVMNNLAGTYYELGKIKKATELMEKVYDLNCSMYGEDHRNTRLFMETLASFYKTVGDTSKALEILKKLNKIP